MEYSVNLTSNAISQIQETVFYISKILNEPNTANAWADYLQKEISKLGTTPARFPLVENEKWSEKGIRKFPVKNFIVYYFFDEDSKAVWITAVCILEKRSAKRAKRYADLNICIGYFIR